MDYWILENLETLVPFVIALLYFIGSNKMKKAEEERSAPDSKANERARRIQEEIRRKILERQQQGKPGGAPAPQPTIVFEDEEPEPEPLHPVTPRSARETVEVETYPRASKVEESVWEEPSRSWEDPFEAQRKQIEEQLQKARELQAKAPTVEARKRSQRRSEAHGSPRWTSRDLTTAVREDLQNGDSVRRAIVLKEILDSPLALR